MRIAEGEGSLRRAESQNPGSSDDVRHQEDEGDGD